MKRALLVCLVTLFVLVGATATDVAQGGPYSAQITLALQQLGLLNAGYTNGQCPVWNSTTNAFAPGACSGGGGSGTVTSVSVVSANGLAGTVATATTTPAITLSTSITGIIKGNGTSFLPAVSGTDYQAPATTFAGYGIVDTANNLSTAIGGQSTGTGNFARATSPTFVTPVLGTPTSATLTNATGYPYSALVSPPYASLGITIDGAGSVISTGTKGFLYVPNACTISSSTLLSTDNAVTSGSIVIDIWAAAYSSYPPTVANTITASALPTLSSAIKAQDSTLTGWTTSIPAGTVLAFHVNSASTVTRVTEVLACR